jgi:hypothetical protein
MELDDILESTPIEENKEGSCMDIAEGKAQQQGDEERKARPLAARRRRAARESSASIQKAKADPHTPPTVSVTAEHSSYPAAGPILPAPALALPPADHTAAIAAAAPSTSDAADERPLAARRRRVQQARDGTLSAGVKTPKSLYELLPDARSIVEKPAARSTRRLLSLSIVLIFALVSCKPLPDIMLPVLSMSFLQVR